jgi:predicted PurR-regulated permease PerM
MFVVPMVMKNTANVNPLVSIVVIIAGAQLFGAAGALLSVPIYIVIRCIYGFWFKKNVISYTSAKALPPLKHS